MTADLHHRQVAEVLHVRGTAPRLASTLESRVTDATGRVQPTEAELESKKTFLEDNSQHPRKVMIA
jgi:hypothetical protein